MVVLRGEMVSDAISFMPVIAMVENTVMVHIRHIREKIEVEPKNPRYVKVVWGIGYKMEKC